MGFLGMELASCHPSDTQNLEVACKLLEHLCTPGLYVSYYTYIQYDANEETHKGILQKENRYCGYYVLQLINVEELFMSIN